MSKVWPKVWPKVGRPDLGNTWYQNRAQQCSQILTRIWCQTSCRGHCKADLGLMPQTWTEMPL